ncbi:hypothetical protein PA15_0304275 [Pseudomonas aeruginosa HB15]|nr:hypothetical protein PA15_0304275 [Pseudomonas aeruginosa HB15]
MSREWRYYLLLLAMWRDSISFAERIVAFLLLLSVRFIRCLYETYSLKVLRDDSFARYIYLLFSRVKDRWTSYTEHFQRT